MRLFVCEIYEVLCVETKFGSWNWIGCESTRSKSHSLKIYHETVILLQANLATVVLVELTAFLFLVFFTRLVHYSFYFVRFCTMYSLHKFGAFGKFNNYNACNNLMISRRVVTILINFNVSHVILY